MSAADHHDRCLSCLGYEHFVLHMENTCPAWMQFSEGDHCKCHQHCRAIRKEKAAKLAEEEASEDTDQEEDSEYIEVEEMQSSPPSPSRSVIPTPSGEDQANPQSSLRCSRLMSHQSTCSSCSRSASPSPAPLAMKRWHLANMRTQRRRLYRTALQTLLPRMGLEDQLSPPQMTGTFPWTRRPPTRMSVVAKPCPQCL